MGKQTPPSQTRQKIKERSSDFGRFGQHAPNENELWHVEPASIRFPPLIASTRDPLSRRHSACAPKMSVETVSVAASVMLIFLVSSVSLPVSPAHTTKSLGPSVHCVRL